MSRENGTASVIMKRSTSIYIWRGPVIVMIALLSLLWPYMSTQFLLYTAVFTLGIACFMADLFSLFEQQIRSSLAKFFDERVLDDILRAVYDPNGVIATTWTTLVANTFGCVSMYSMKMDEDQRTQLFQAGYQIPKKDARKILLEKGGMRFLLSDSMRNWLYRDTEVEPPIQIASKDMLKERREMKGMEIEAVETESEASEMECADADTSPASPTNDTEQASHESDTSYRYMNLHLEGPEQIPSDPAVVFQSILSGMVRDKVRSCIASIPETTLDKVATTATSLLIMQVCWRFVSRTNTKVLGPKLLGPIVSAIATGAATGSLATVLGRSYMTGNVQDLTSARRATKEFVARILHNLRPVVLKRIIVTMVFAWLRSKKLRNTSRPIRR